MSTCSVTIISSVIVVLVVVVVLVAVVVQTTKDWLCINVLTTKEESPTWGNHCLGVFRFAVLLSILKGFLQII